MAANKYHSILSIDDLERAATDRMDRMTRSYFNSGADGLVTLRDNINAFDRYKLRPRVLRDVTHIDPSTMFLGKKVAFPLCIAPTAMQRMAHPDGELATARAAAKRGIAMGLSSYSTTPLEEVVVAAKEVGDIDHVLQLYMMKNRRTSESLVKRAERAGYKAIFLTVDTPYLGRRFAETRNAFALPTHLSLGNFAVPNLKNGVSTPNRGEGGAAKVPDNDIVSVVRDVQTSGPGKVPERADILNEQGLPKIGFAGEDGVVDGNDTSLNWEDIKWLRSLTKMQIWLKGVLTEEDTQLAISHGVDGILISNHGGRQLDSATSTLDALPECVAAAKGRIPIHIDGGIRRGSDIFKALALGAQGVWIGRIPIWGLAYDGEAGVDLALKILYEEFVLCMGLAGCRNVTEIEKGHLARVGVDGRVSKL